MTTQTVTTTEQRLTVDRLKFMTTEKHLVTLARTVFEAMAYAQTVREVIEPKQRAVLYLYQWKPAKQWEKWEGVDKVILEPKHAYMLDDADFKIYLKEMEIFHKEQGFNVPKDHCPLLVAESMLRDARRYFIDALEPYTGMSFDNLICSKDGLKNLDTYIDINLKLFAPFVSKTIN